MKDYLKLRKEELKKRGAKGFTLMEMLIVVAIIAVLIAIAIPIFTSQLEKSREATDAANIRSAYGVIQAAALTQETQTELSKQNTDDTTYTVSGAEGSYVYTAVVELHQSQDEWQSGDQNIGGITISASNAKASGTATITHTQSTGATDITMSTN
jgi:type IV pilus assembly protein PilA